MSLSYKNIRDLYYLGIAVLIVYALPAARQYTSGILDYEPITGISVVAVIAVLTGIGAVAAYKYRKLG